MDGLKLEPCPFCGGSAEIVTHEYTGLSCKDYGVVCRSCSAQTYQFFTTPEKAAELWNRRAYEKEKDKSE